MRPARFPFLLAVLLCLTLFLSLQGKMEIQNTSASSTLQDDHSLRFVTYNIRGCRDDMGIADPFSIAFELQELHPDVIALQEVDNGLPRSNFVNQAKVIADQLDMNYIYTPTINFFVGTYGHAILSKHPIDSYQNVPLPSNTEPRKLLEVTIRVNYQPIRIFSTHLGLPSSERKKQIQILQAYVQKKSDVPSVLLGDFNTKPIENVLDPIRKLFFDPSKKQTNLITIDTEKSKTQLDYIFLSKEFQFLDGFSDASEKRSDHFPLTYVVSITRG